MLHLIFQSPINNAVLDRMAEGDAAVFMESAVLGLMKKSQFTDVLKGKLGSHDFYVLSEDIAVRGILPSEIVAGLEVIDYPSLVKLTVEHPLIQSWR